VVDRQEVAQLRELVCGARRDQEARPWLGHAQRFTVARISAWAANS
jgi:hypothetical protein